MRISLQIFIGYFLIVAIAAWFVLAIFAEEVKPGVRQSTEDALVDSAQVLANIAAQDIKNNTTATGSIAKAFAQINQRPFQSNIGGVIKTRVDYRVYITDDKGIVRYDSSGKDVGADYSRWNDVYLTLRGQYGARSTPSVAGNDATSVMHVAAPIIINDKIAGVLTVSKPNSTLMPIINRSEARITQAGIILLGASLLVGLIIMWWINRSISRLERYADDITAGKSVPKPKFISTELRAIINTIATMRERLDGKEYVEQYVHTLTHELKSPLSAIRGAAEIIKEHPPEAVQTQFATNIEEQSHRLQTLIDRLLELANLERAPALSLQPVALRSLLDTALSAQQTELARRNITLSININGNTTVQGDEFLLGQMFSNLIDNAMDFSPNDSSIQIYDEPSLTQHRISIRDHGAGIPDYALPHIFDRFYSLARPHKSKSTGLGLNFVREIMTKHDGQIDIQNHLGGGVLVKLVFPKSLTAKFDLHA
jgi:two-component system sensor histidine kinase CreC